MRGSDLPGAIDEFSQAIADNPNDVTAYRLRAQAESVLRRFDAALADYTRAIALDPRSSVAFDDRANFKSNQHDFAGALADIDQAIALHSGMPPLDFLYDFRARTNLALHRDDAALSDINRALQLAPTVTPHLYTRETIEIDRYEYDAAIADDTQIIALTSGRDRAMPYLRRGDAREAKGDHAGAIADYTQVIDLGGFAAVQGYRKRASVRRAIGDDLGAQADEAMARGEALTRDTALPLTAIEQSAHDKMARLDYAGAIEDLTRAIAANPNLAILYRERAQAEELSGHLGAALSDVSQSIARDSSALDGYIMRANLKSRMNDPRGAIADISVVISANPQDWSALSTRARWERREAQLAAAVRDFDQALSVLPATAPPGTAARLRDERGDAASTLQQQAAHALTQAASLQTIAIQVDGPARVGMPIWIHADLKGPLVARYPFAADPRHFGSNRLELKRDGQLLPPRTGISLGGPVGLIEGSIAPPNSPQNRLPLHVGYNIDRPGHYSVRWTVVASGASRTPPPSAPLAQSDWLDFDVAASSRADLEAWLVKLLAAPPSDAGAYVGDYLPSLLASASDLRVARAVMDGTASTTGIVVSCAQGALAMLPAEAAVALTLETLRQRGPVPGVTSLVSMNATWFQDHRDEIIGAAVASLKSPDSALVEGGLRLIGFVALFDWPADSATQRDANRAVEAAAPALMTRTDQIAQALAIQLGQIGDLGARDLLWQLIGQHPSRREQALMALTWIRDPRDLPKIADLLMQAGNEDPRGSNLGGLVGALRRAYGDASIPFLEKALADSPYIWVKTQSAEQLALAGRVDAFKFFLDALDMNRSYRPELENWLRQTFSGAANTDTAGLIGFLQAEVKDPRPPTAANDDPVRTAIAGLQSTESGTRKLAAQTLIDLAGESAMSLNRVGSSLVDLMDKRVGSGAGDVGPETWRDAALIIGRAHIVFASGRLGLHLERDGVADALIEIGGALMSMLNDILTVGGPSRRRIAAQVLGAIGGDAARSCLSDALNRESDPAIQQAIQTALTHLGQRPARAEIR